MTRQPYCAFTSGARTLPALFARSLVARADLPALHWRESVSTFDDIARRSTRLASVLRGRGLRKGDRLGVYLPNSPAWIDLYVACSSLGMIVVPINVLYREREVGHILSDAAPAAIVAAGDVPGAGATPVWTVDALVSAAPGESATHEESLVPDDPALIVYTSGTTGRPKGAVLSHANLVANAEALLEAWAITARDRLLLTLPLFHVHGLGNGLHCWLAAGCLLRLEERFDHQHAAGWFREFQPTLFFGVPTIYSRLLEVDETEARAIGAKARLFVSGSAPLPAAVIDAIEQRFGQRILERYGMTETLMTLGNPLDGERRAGSIGLPLPGVAARMVDTFDAPVAVREVGELQVKGPTVFRGYWRREDATAAAFTADGWFRTGDLAERADDGYVTLRGRRSDLIISGGFNIYPREVEEVLLEHPSVDEVAVAGVPDARRGELPAAFIVPAAGMLVDAQVLERHCRERLASFKVPRRFVSVDRLPRNALGKVVKSQLPLDGG